jgi:hypothetical protein
MSVDVEAVSTIVDESIILVTGKSEVVINIVESVTVVAASVSMEILVEAVTVTVDAVSVVVTVVFGAPRQ